MILLLRSFFPIIFPLPPHLLLGVFSFVPRPLRHTSINRSINSSLQAQLNQLWAFIKAYYATSSGPSPTIHHDDPSLCLLFSSSRIKTRYFVLSLSLSSLTMDSLLANYVSSDDDDEQDKDPKPSPSSISSIDLPPPKSKPSLCSTLPPPKTLAPSSSSSTYSSLFSSLPPPKSQPPNPPTEAKESKQKKPIFASLPPPKSQQPSNPNPNPKRVVQFTLPLNPSLLKPDDEDDEEEQQRKPIVDSSTSAPSKGLSSMLPAPKNSLCLVPSAASRRSAFDSRISSSSASSNKEENTNFGSKGEIFEQDKGKVEEFGTSYPVEQGGASGYDNYGSYDGNGDANGVNYENYGGYDGSWAANRSADPGYDTGYVSTVGVDNGSYAGNWNDGNAAAMAAAPVVVPEMERIVGKRGRNEIPAEIVEVNQAELIKNRPREDQVKVTGIAFGPAYQV